MYRNEKVAIAALLVALGVACRLLPHLWNFAPITAIALFSGAYLGRRFAVAVPLLAMAIGDYFIGFYELPLLVAVYGCVAASGLVGCFLARRKDPAYIFIGTVGSSIMFFLATNWAVWQFSPWYEKTLAGLAECYLLAIPFFRSSLLSDIFYVAVLFGAYEAIRYSVASRKLAKANII